MRRAIALGCLLALLAGCAAPKPVFEEKASPNPERKPVASKPAPPLTGRALIAHLLPPRLGDREGWARDIGDAMTAIGVTPAPSNVCEVVAIIGQESGFRADPAIPGLPEIARREIERRRSAAGIPGFLVRAALALPSTDGRSYGERLDAVRTERQLSALYEDFVSRVPVGRAFLDARNPIRTGGPMQVSVGFAEAYAAAHPSARAPGSIRDRVFSRRGGLYFGIAYLLDYVAPYDDPIYRFADYNAGRYASRNAAFQSALARLSGRTLALDGDLRGETARAALRLAPELGLSAGDIARELALGREPGLEGTRLYAAVYRLAGPGAARARLPRIVVHTPKTARRLTVAGFAREAERRYRACLARG